VNEGNGPFTNQTPSIIFWSHRYSPIRSKRVRSKIPKIVWKWL